MHSNESLRNIRALEYLFGSCNNPNLSRRNISQRSLYQEPRGRVFATLTYDLATKEIIISEPDSRD